MSSTPTPNTNAPNHSPMKGIERLSEELRLERQKANHALQDRARTRIEVETLKQTIEQQRHDLQELQAYTDELKLSLQQSLHNIEQLEALNHQLSEQLNTHAKESQHVKDLMKGHEQDAMHYRELLQEKEDEIMAWKVKLETAENKSASKDELIEHLKQELLNIRQVHMNIEQEKLSTYEQLSYKLHENEELQTKLQIADVLESGYNQTKLSNEELRRELDKSIELNMSLNHQIREFNAKFAEKSMMERTLNDQIKQLVSERDELSIIMKELDRNNEEMNSQLRVEVETRLSLQEKAELAVQNRVFVDEQLQQLRQLYEEMKSNQVTLQESESSWKRKASLQAEEILMLKDQVQDYERIQEEMKNVHVLMIEMETLRSQLNSMRKKLIQRDLEEEAGVMTPQAIMDREQSGRQVYEGIIQDLRTEIDKMNIKYHDLLRKYDEVMVKAGRVEQLEEEVEMYKEMAKNLTAESQTVALTASEVADRQVKSTHERQNLLQEVYRLETELESSQVDIERLKNEILSLRDKLKVFHQQKLNADKRSTELLAMNSKLEASLEDFRQQYDKMVIDYEKMKRQSIDTSTQVAEFKVLQQDYEIMKVEKEELMNQLTHYKTLHYHHEKSSQQQQEMIQMKMSSLDEEVANLTQRLQYTLQQLEESKGEQLKYRKQYEDVVADRDRLKTELNLQQSQHAEDKLNELKSELNQTVQEFTLYEEEKKKKEHIMTTLQGEYNKEKEKNILMTMQIQLLEERLKVVNQELAVFRGIDVYHASMQAELEHYRKAGNTQTPSTAESKPTIAKTTSSYSIPYSNPLLLEASRRSNPASPIKSSSAVTRATPIAAKFSLDDINSTSKWGTTLSSFAGHHDLPLSQSQVSRRSDDSDDVLPLQTEVDSSNHAEEKQREIQERLLRKAQREERLRQLILAQDKRAITSAITGKPSTTNTATSLYSSKSFTIGETHQTPNTTIASNPRSGSINKALNRPAASTSSRITPTSAHNPLASSRYSGDIERARRLLSM